MSVDYQQVFAKLPSACAILSPEFEILAANEAFERASMRSKDQLIGRILSEVFPESPDDPAADGVNKLRASNTPVLDARGQVRFIIHIAQPTTEMMRLQQRVHDEHSRLIESNVALEASNEELEAFCYSVAHDLRAPLRGIQGFSQALIEDYADAIDDQGRRHLQRVSAAALRMSELIDDLLTLSRISRAALTRTRIDLSAIANRIAADLDRHGNRSVAITIAPGLVATADERLVHIALENLLNNAWKFTSKTERPRVEFGADTIDGVTTFFVRDNGAGFDEAYASKLFAPFQRLHSDKEFSGTGVGLATVQRIVRRHGGRIWARAAVDRGATFYFTLPD